MSELGRAGAGVGRRAGGAGGGFPGALCPGLAGGRGQPRLFTHAQLRVLGRAAGGVRELEQDRGAVEGFSEWELGGVCVS